jgi:WD40 repeat protein
MVALQFLAETGRILAQCADGAITTLDLETGRRRPLDVRAMPGRLAMSFAADGSQFAVPTASNRVAVVDMEAGLLGREIAVEAVALTGVALNPSGKRLVTVARDRVWLWEVPSGKLMAGPLGHSNYVFRVQFSSDGSRLITATRSGSLQIWDAGTSSLPVKSVPHPADLGDAQISADGNWVVTGADDGLVRLFDAKSGEVRWSAPGTGSPVRITGFLPTGNRLVAAYLDGSVRLFELRTGLSCSERLVGLRRPAVLAVSRDTRTLAFADEEAGLGLYVMPPRERSIQQSRQIVSLATWLLGSAPEKDALRGESLAAARLIETFQTVRGGRAPMIGR